MAIGLVTFASVIAAVPAQAAATATITRVIILDDEPSSTDWAELPYGDGRRIWLDSGSYEWRHTIRSVGDHHSVNRPIDLAAGWYWWQCHLWGQVGDPWDPNYTALCLLEPESGSGTAFLPAGGYGAPAAWLVYGGEFTWTSDLTPV
ncbi:hypothetical protein A4R43_41080 [Amycolatopsis albispora]|uniref:Uncharacterized protein n=2 Tax=Amycolatopsis albispora TaxID=1804986 RepID=A0A344LJ23_9PSEU|nr:hypothetical protein A4R43_41080 [Amycolatopsis albispora]